MTAAEQSLRGVVSEAARTARGPAAALRRDAALRFGELGLPTTKLEEWRFTSLAALAPLAFQRVGPVSPPDEGELEFHAGPAAGVRLTFLNGRFLPARSVLAPLPGGAFAGSLAAALRDREEDVLPHLGRLAAPEDHAFAAFNTAAFEDGAFVYLPAGVRVEAPIEILYVTLAPDRAPVVTPRTLVVAEAGSEATVVETHVGSSLHPYLSAPVAELRLGEGARVDHYEILQEGERGFHLGVLGAEQARDSQLSTHVIAAGGALARHEVRAVMTGEGGQCAMNGLYVVGGRQLVDNLSLVEHAAPRCTSRETYKGILDGASRAVFSGRIMVREGAQKTDAYQGNSNLLLSDDAVVDAKPQLEIWADDVKCGHGGTVGQLDEDALFYLQSRGIPREDARTLLSYAFASEMVGRVRPPALRSRVRRLVAGRLPQGERLLEAA